MKKERKPMDCRRALTNAKRLLFTGLIIFIILLIPGLRLTTLLPIIMFLTGFSLVIGGIVYASLYCVCPHCGRSLLHGIRLPDRIPDYCPHCGKAIPYYNDP